MSEQNLSAMSRDELEQTAADLGVNYPHNISDDKLRTKIAEHLGEPAATAPTATEGSSAKRFEIIVQTDSRDKQPVQVGVNGRMYVIKRGVKVIVPAAVVEVLNHAVRYEYDPADMQRTEVLAYPFQIARELEA